MTKLEPLLADNGWDLTDGYWRWRLHEILVHRSSFSGADGVRHYCDRYGNKQPECGTNDCECRRLHDAERQAHESDA